MRAVVQRVLEASVEVNNEVVGRIGRGLCVLVGLTHEDDQGDLDYIARKLLAIRLFDDDKAKPWQKCVKDLGCELLLVSQFTLYARLKGNKPDYHLSTPGGPALIMFDKLLTQLRREYAADKVQTGVFGADMKVKMCNDGPVTIILDSNSREPVLKAGKDKGDKDGAGGEEEAGVLA